MFVCLFQGLVPKSSVLAMAVKLRLAALDEEDVPTGVSVLCSVFNQLGCSNL